MKLRKYSEYLLAAEMFWKHEGQQRMLRTELPFLATRSGLKEERKTATGHYFCKQLVWK